MAKQADVCWLVTTEIIQPRFTPKIVSVRMLCDGWLECGVWWLREKPILTYAVVKQRCARAQKYRNKTPAWWQAIPKYMAMPKYLRFAIQQLFNNYPTTYSTTYSTTLQELHIY